MSAGRHAILREERWSIEAMRQRKPPRRPLAPFEAWIEGQDLPRPLLAPSLARCSREAACRLWAIVAPWLDRGLRVRHYPRHRVVTVFGTVQYRVTDEGRMVDGAVRGLSAQRMLGGNVPIDAPLRTWGFVPTLLAADRRDWIEETARQMQAVGLDGRHADACTRTATEWAERLVDRYLHRLVDVLAVERKAVEAMGLDPGVLRMARRIAGSKRRSGGLDTSIYESFRDLLPALQEVERLEPVLMPLAWVTRHAWSKARVPPLQYLREALAKRGVGPEGWRRLRAMRPRPVWEHWNRHQIAGAERLLDFMADWARVHEGLPLQTRMPWPLWDTLARTSVEPGDERLIPPVAWPCRPAVLRGALEKWAAAPGPAARQAFVDGDWTRVVRWSAHYGGNVPAGRKTTWPAVLAAATEDERLRRARALATDVRWRSPIEAFTWGGLRVVPLTDPVALTEEAIALRTCVDTFQAACAAGKRFLFGFRDAATGRRLATLALSREGSTVEIYDLRRMANQSPTEQEQALADEVLERVRDALQPHRRAGASPRGLGQLRAGFRLDWHGIHGLPHWGADRLDLARPGSGGT
ncbi:MAG: hypothetical protein ACK4JC_02630 [Silanimonas lenta]